MNIVIVMENGKQHEKHEDVHVNENKKRQSPEMNDVNQLSTDTTNGAEEVATNGAPDQENIGLNNGVSNLNVDLEERKQEDEEDDDVDSHRTRHLDGQSDGNDRDSEDEEEVLVALELADFKNHPIIDDYRSIKIEGIDTTSPVLRIGEYMLHGQLQEAVGTNFFYDIKNRTKQNYYSYLGQTTKRIKFTIAPPEE